MIRKSELAEVMGDASLSPEARVLIVHIAMLGDGEHEISYRSLSRLLCQIGEKKLRQAVQDAAETGWITVNTQAGRGHHPRFEFSPSKRAELKDSYAQKDELKKDSYAENDKLNGDSRAGVTTQVVSLPTEEDEEEEGARALDDQTEHRIQQEAAVLDEAIEPLRDYLLLRVPPDRRGAYVGGVTSLLRHATTFDWSTSPGTQVPVPKRSGYVADALSELAASDEAKGHSRPVGDLGNLKTKLQVLLKPPKPNGKHAAGTEASRVRDELPAAPRLPDRTGVAAQVKPPDPEVRQAGFAMIRDAMQRSGP